MNILFKLLLLIKTLSNFPTAFLDKMGILKGELVYKIRNKDIQFIARAGTEDMAEIVVVASGHEYNIKSIKLPKQPVIVDLGGHIGTFSIFIAKVLKNRCKIYAFEPNKDNYLMFLRNIKLNKISFVYLKNIAISDYVGKGYLKTEEMNTDAYYLDQSGKKFNCIVSTLPKELKMKKVKKIDLLKIDIEGAEYNILLHKDSFNYILKNVHYIFMEYHNINKYKNYSLIKKKFRKNFKIINERRNILTLENTDFKK